MLYECPIADDVLWLIILSFLKFKITRNAIICEVKDKIFNFLLSLISFFLHKYWVIITNENCNCISKNISFERTMFAKMGLFEAKTNLCEKISKRSKK